MIYLDDLTLLRRGDPGSMPATIAELPEAVAQAWRQSRGSALEPVSSQWAPSSAVVLLLQTSDEHPRMNMRERVTQRILEKRG